MKNKNIREIVLRSIKIEMENNDSETNDIKMTDVLLDDLNIDSMGFITIICRIEDELGLETGGIVIEDLDFDSYSKLTVQKLIDILEKYMKNK